MAYRTVAEVKAFAAQMLSQHETDAAIAGSTAENTADLIERWLTAAWDRIATYRDWHWLSDQISLTWPAGTSTSPAVLYLPHFIQRIVGFVPPLGQYPVQIVTPTEFDKRRGLTPQDMLVIFGYYGVEADCTTAGAITATSSLAATDNGLQVRIEGLTTDNYDNIETITLAGLGTATTSGLAFKGAQGGVRRVSIVPGTVPTGGGGIVTITDAGGTTLERLDANREREHEHQRTQLHAGLSNAQTQTVRFIRRAFNVTADTDIIPIPNEFSDLIELGIEIELARFRKDYAVGAQMRGEWRERMRELMAWSNRTYSGYRTVVAPRIYSA